MLKSIFLISLLLLTGCATTESYITNKSTSETISGADLNANIGILTGTFSRKKSYEHTFRALRFKNIDTGVTYSIQKLHNPSLLFNTAKPHFSEEKGMDGEVFAFILPAGNYTIYDFAISAAGYNSTRTWSSKEAFSIPFAVNANQVNYLGSFHFTPTFGRNLLGLKAPDAGYWILNDELERDKRLITSVYSSLPVNNMNVVIPSTKEVFTPVIIFPSEISSIQQNTE